MTILAATLAAAVITWGVNPVVTGLLRKTNYRGAVLGGCGGLALVAGALAGWWALASWGASGDSGLVALATAIMCALGLLDDKWGDNSAKGLKGHLRGWLRLEGDTALIKTVGGLSIGLWAGFTRETSLGPALLDALCFALLANAVNLLDLRPGRAVKGFMLGAVLMSAFGGAAAVFMFPFMGAVAAYLPRELREEMMLGDCGANALGAVLGASAILLLSWPVRLALVVFLLALHWYAERFSISRTIERVSWLTFVDRLGRSRI